MTTRRLVVDLILVIEGDGARTMSACALDVENRANDRLFGPVPYKDAIGVLAAELHQAYPAHYPTLRLAESHLTMVHLRNMAAHRNFGGQDYPYFAARKEVPVP